MFLFLFERLLGDFRWRGRCPQNGARITVKSTLWFALFNSSCLASSTLAGQFLLFVKFRFFDLLSIQILVLRISLSRHLRTITHHPERDVASDRVHALVVCHSIFPKQSNSNSASGFVLYICPILDDLA